MPRIVLNTKRMLTDTHGYYTDTHGYYTDPHGYYLLNAHAPAGCEVNGLPLAGYKLG